MGDVTSEEVEVETGLLEHGQVRVFLNHFDVRRAWVAADVALASLELLQAYGCAVETRAINIRMCGCPSIAVYLYDH